MTKAFKIERRGRPKKPGKRYPSGDLEGKGVCTAADYLYAILGDCAAVYIMEAGPAVKIGVSGCTTHRAKALQTGQQHPVKPVWRMWLMKKDALKVEREVHKALRKTGMHAHGEMYYMDAGRASEVIGSFITRLGVRAWSESFIKFPEYVVR